MNLPDKNLPRPDDGGEPVFQAPWEAQAFALAVLLHERGIFAWDEWTRALAAEIHRAPAQEDAGSQEPGYYEHWLAALEKLVTEKHLTDPHQLSQRRDAWARATSATPHGEPILLTNDPMAKG